MRLEEIICPAEGGGVLARTEEGKTVRVTPFCPPFITNTFIKNTDKEQDPISKAERYIKSTARGNYYQIGMYSMTPSQMTSSIMYSVPYQIYKEIE